METVVVVDYGSGNLRSVTKALERAAAESDIRARITVAQTADSIAAADRLVLPGVGAFGDCRAGLDRLEGVVAAMESAVTAGGRPFLGICVGMQLMARVGREHGVHQGLGWIEGEVVPLAPDDPALPIPHMGWNDLAPPLAAHPVLDGLASGDHAYFVHSYHLRCDDPATVLAQVEYGGKVAAVVGRDNLLGCQFHPEKSQAVGLGLLRRFLEWRP